MDILDNDIEVDNNNEAMEAINGDKRHRRSQRSAEYKSWDLYVYTIAMFVNHFAVGVNSGIGGPALVDLRYMLNTTINLISISLVINNIGYLSGSLFGLLYKYINRQLTIVVIMAAMAASITLIPDCPNLWILYLFQYAIGLGAGIWDTANNVWLIEMWPQNSSPVLQFSQFMYGLGSVFGPIIVKPYLTGETNHTLAIQLSDFGDITSTPSAPVDRRALLRTPYLISGILQGFIPVVFLIMYFVKQYKSRDQRLKRKDSSESLLSDHLDDRDDGAVRSSQIEDNCLESTYSPRKRLALIALFSLFIAIYASLEVAHFSYSSTYYQYMELKISAKTAAEILSVMSTSYTVGRCLSAFIAIKVGPQVMIIYHLLIIIAGMAVLYYGSHILALIWIGNIILGFGFSAMYPAIIALTAKHCKLTDTVSTVMVFSNGTVSAITPFILGPIIENYSYVFIELEIVYLIISTFVFLVIITVTNKPVTHNRALQSPGAYDNA